MFDMLKRGGWELCRFGFMISSFFFLEYMCVYICVWKDEWMDEWKDEWKDDISVPICHVEVKRTNTYMNLSPKKCAYGFVRFPCLSNLSNSL